MVRSLVGALVEVGSGRRDRGWLDAVAAAARPRPGDARCWPPRGLTLEEVGYPADTELAERAQAGPDACGRVTMTDALLQRRARRPGAAADDHGSTLAVGSVELLTANGVFAGDGLDRGTAVLLRESPMPTGRPRILRPRLRLRPDRAGHRPGLSGRGGRRRRRQRPGAGAVPRQRRARSASPTGSACCGPRRSIRETRYDEIWSNPPIRIGKEALHDAAAGLAAPARARRRRPAGGRQEPRRRHAAALAERAGVRRRAGRHRQGLPRPRLASVGALSLSKGPERVEGASARPLRDRLEHLGPAAVEHPAALGDPDPEHHEAGHQPDRQREVAHPGGEERPDDQARSSVRRRSTCRNWSR